VMNADIVLQAIEHVEPLLDELADESWPLGRVARSLAICGFRHVSKLFT
jgi:hypothetical protein